MTTQVGTFIPLQAQNLGWGSNGLNHNTNWGITGYNPNSGYNHFTGLNQGYAHTPHNTSVLLLSTPGYTNVSEFAQGIAPQGSHVTFVPNQGTISAGSFIPGTTTMQGIPGGTTLLGLAGGLQGLQGLQGGQQVVGGVSHSFATELSENNNEYVISFDVPGIDIHDLDISLAGSTILINGIRKGTHDASTLAYSEIARGSISRAIAVPFDLSPNKAINTSLENGVLKIRIAKESHSDKKMGTRKVKIG